MAALRSGPGGVGEQCVAKQAASLLEDLRSSLDHGNQEFESLVWMHLQAHGRRQEELVMRFAARVAEAQALPGAADVADLRSRWCDGAPEWGARDADDEDLAKLSPRQPGRKPSSRVTQAPGPCQVQPLKDPDMNTDSIKLLAHLIVTPLCSSLQRVEALVSQRHGAEARRGAELPMSEEPRTSAAEHKAGGAEPRTDEAERNAGFGSEAQDPKVQLSVMSSVMSMSDAKAAAKKGKSVQFYEEETSMSTWQLKSEHGSQWGQKMYQRWRDWIEWWANLKEPARSGCLAGFTLSSRFSNLCASFIFANAIFLIVSTNRDIELLDGSQTLEMRIGEMIFVCFFTFELVTKVLVHRQYYFCNEDMRWNIFDFLLICTALFEVVMENTSTATLLRPLRLLKMAKILRVARLMHFFPILSMMLNSLIGSLGILFWSLTMLTFMFYLFAVALVQGATTTLMGHNLEPGIEELLLNKFGSVQSAMLTLYMVAFGGMDWEYVYDLMEKCGLINAFLFICFVSLMNIAILNILTGIFVECALKLAQPDREFLACERRIQRVQDYEEFRILFYEIQQMAPGCPSNIITREAFLEASANGRIKAHMEILGLHITDPERCFNCFMAGSKDEVELNEFVDGCMELRGNATGIDIEVALCAMKALAQQQEVEQQQQQLARQSADAFQAAVMQRLWALDNAQQARQPFGYGSGRQGASEVKLTAGAANLLSDGSDGSASI